MADYTLDNIVLDIKIPFSCTIFLRASADCPLATSAPRPYSPGKTLALDPLCFNTSVALAQLEVWSIARAGERLLGSAALDLTLEQPQRQLKFENCVDRKAKINLILKRQTLRDSGLFKVGSLKLSGLSSTQSARLSVYSTAQQQELELAKMEISLLRRELESKSSKYISELRSGLQRVNLLQENLDRQQNVNRLLRAQLDPLITLKTKLQVHCLSVLGLSLEGGLEEYLSQVQRNFEQVSAMKMQLSMLQAAALDSQLAEENRLALEGQLWRFKDYSARLQQLLAQLKQQNSKNNAQVSELKRQNEQLNDALVLARTEKQDHEEQKLRYFRMAGREIGELSQRVKQLRLDKEQLEQRASRLETELRLSQRGLGQVQSQTQTEVLAREVQVVKFDWFMTCDEQQLQSGLSDCSLCELFNMFKWMRAQLPRERAHARRQLEQAERVQAVLRESLSASKASIAQLDSSLQRERTQNTALLRELAELRISEGEKFKKLSLRAVQKDSQVSELQNYITQLEQEHQQREERLQSRLRQCQGERRPRPFEGSSVLRMSILPAAG